MILCYSLIIKGQRGLWSGLLASVNYSHSSCDDSWMWSLYDSFLEVNLQKTNDRLTSTLIIRQILIVALVLTSKNNHYCNVSPRVKTLIRQSLIVTLVLISNLTKITLITLVLTSSLTKTNLYCNPTSNIILTKANLYCNPRSNINPY